MKEDYLKLVNILSSTMMRVFFSVSLIVLVAGTLVPNDAWAGKQKPNDELRQECENEGGILDDDGGDAVVCTFPATDIYDTMVVGCDNDGCTICGGAEPGCVDYARRGGAKHRINVNQIPARRFTPRIRARLRAAGLRKKSRIRRATPRRKTSVAPSRRSKKSGKTPQKKMGTAKPAAPMKMMPLKK